MSDQARTPSEVLATQLPRFRQQAGDLSGAALSRKIEERGGKLGRMSISKIENGQRGVSLDEALMLADALSVAPVHLFTPLDDGAQVAVTPGNEETEALTATARSAREWVRGRLPLTGADEKMFRTAVPESEWKADQGPSEEEREARQRVERARHRLTVAERKLALVAENPVQTTSTMDRMGALARGAAVGLSAEDYQLRRQEERLDRALTDVAEAEVEYEDAARELRAIVRATENTETS